MPPERRRLGPYQVGFEAVPSGSVRSRSKIPGRSQSRSLTLPPTIRKPFGYPNMSQFRNEPNLIRSITRIGFVLLLLVQDGLAQTKIVGRLSHPPIKEASGITASRKYPGIFWVQNDSGNEPYLFAVRADGTLVGEFRVNAPNVDWEDIATDDEGHIYIGDIGNNGGRLPLRSIYRVNEPNPHQKPTEPLKVNLFAHYKFPSGNKFDAEGLFVEGSTAFIVSKRFDKKNAGIYQVPLDGKSSLLKPVTIEELGFLPDFDEPATGASLSKNGQLLAVCANSKARVYQRLGDNRWKKLATIKNIGETVEAICWDGPDLLLAGENRVLYRINEQAWRSAKDDR